MASKQIYLAYEKIISFTEMDRRNLLKTLTLGALTPKFILENNPPETASINTSVSPQEIQKAESKPFQSDWKSLPDMVWTGEELWAQRLQDWGIKNGELTCFFSGPNRTVHLLTHQLSNKQASFQTSATVKILNITNPKKGNFAGFKIGVKGTFDDYRSAIMTGKGLNVGVNTDGSLFIGQAVSLEKISATNLSQGFQLTLTATPEDGDFVLTLTAASLGQNKAIASIKNENIPSESLVGNIALISHFEGNSESETTSASFADWRVEGEKVSYFPQQVYGPIYFAQYTVNNGVLKLSAQLAPVNLSINASAVLELKKKGSWEKAAEATIHPQARVAAFRISSWDSTQAVPYRIRYELPSNSGQPFIHYYEGTIAAEPTDKDKVKAYAFSCNGDMGFPDNDVVENASKHKADLILFLGDQFYERNGDFRIQTAPLDKAILDCLRKWVQFGWSYRELFRHIPSVCLPDDHDVYHGNIWGSRGRAALQEGNNNERQDSGGYKMPAEWVNMSQLCQTSHMPDPYDPTPVLQGINVYYTHWQYGGISFGIIEDRKFKSAPKEILPPEAKVHNGYAENQEFDIRKFTTPETASLIGDRQIQFLKEWSKDWSKGAQFKVLASATSFMCLQTLPKGTLNDSVTGKLEIPEPGVYVSGDAPTRDMDTDGWPQNRRDEVVELLRKSFTFHIAGDQHLPSVVQYGLEKYGDSGFVFTVPALGNVFPRRWWPPVEKDHQHLPGQPAYTGNFEDGFGNKVTVHAVANPFKTGKQPAEVYDRVPGYGLVTFDKQTRKITLECWPRYVDPIKNPKGQYLGWPITIDQFQNYGKQAIGYLPQLKITGITNPVVQVILEGQREPEYTIRIKGTEFQPKVFKEGTYTVIVSDPDTNKKKELKGMAITTQKKSISVAV
jgi:hypothetical protein